MSGEKLIANIPEVLKARAGKIKCYAEDGSSFDLDFKVAPVKVKKTKEEAQEIKRLYRREYAKRPKVRAKINERLNDPKMKEKRLEYSKREDVKERKKFLAAKNRKIRNLLKYENPSLYKTYEKMISSEFTPSEQ